MAERQLIFRQIITHIKIAQQGETTISFFDDDPLYNDPSITIFGEHQILNWVFNNSSIRNFFFDSVLKSTNNVKYALRVDRPVIEAGQKPGDVDILMWPEGKFEQAVAIECKRTIVKIAQTGKEKVNRLSEIHKGIKQANQLRELGFYRSYVAFFILTDGRHKKEENTLFRNAHSDTVHEIYDVPMSEELHKDVGVIYVRICQPTGLNHDLMNGFGVCVDKEAIQLEQPRELTEKIRKFSILSNAI